MKTYLLLSHIRVHNANAASSLYTIGFPAMTSWLGAMHALERKLRAHAFSHIELKGLGISCHSMNLQTYKDAGMSHAAIIGTANPFNALKYDKEKGEYERSPFIQEPRVHLEVSLLIELSGLDVNEEKGFEETVRNLLPQMKMAGGDIQNSNKDLRVKCLPVDDHDPEDVRKVMRSLVPGCVLLERRSRLLRYMEEKQEKDALTALLDHLIVDVKDEANEAAKEISWQRTKKIAGGWTVPIAVGFRALSGATTGACCRDASTEHHFVEPLVTLGEFVLPIRVESVEDMMWTYHHEEDKGYYLCRNEKE
ncbi:hypothetical protein TAMA11512_19140 [Selenomonas sp. TAMA-11512]|uniref:type I-F CRISPR-associated protein Csy2 n=1 Tax=Selenomonas sp. TAMA-11512 TaxID=3095337 RepID=UPI00308D0921|nr:hypothetical protein TAMA11512_19140 [Selenomonas sp. TAMA-11512]